MMYQHKTTVPRKLPKGLRKFEVKDAEAMLEIINETSDTGANSPFIRPMTQYELNVMLVSWIQINTPIYVFERNGKVIAWVSITPFSWWGTQACRLTGEVAVYVSQNYISKGIGYRLSQAAILLAQEHGYENLVTWILEKNNASKALAEAFGGELWAKLPKIACFGGQRSDVYLHGLNLSSIC